MKDIIIPTLAVIGAAACIFVLSAIIAGAIKSIKESCQPKACFRPMGAPFSSVPRMQNPPPPPPHPRKLRLFHNGKWFIPFDENGNEILCKKVVIKEKFPEPGQDAIIVMPVEIVNERPKKEAAQ